MESLSVRYIHYHHTHTNLHSVAPALQREHTQSNEYNPAPASIIHRYLHEGRRIGIVHGFRTIPLCDRWLLGILHLIPSLVALRLPESGGGRSTRRHRTSITSSNSGHCRQIRGPPICQTLSTCKRARKAFDRRCVWYKIEYLTRTDKQVWKYYNFILLISHKNSNSSWLG